MGGQLFTSLRETVGTGSVLGLKVPLGVDGDLTLAAFDDQGFGYVRVTDDFKSLQIDYQPATGTPADSIAIDLRTQPLGSPQSAVKFPASHHRTHAPVRRSRFFSQKICAGAQIVCRARCVHQNKNSNHPGPATPRGPTHLRASGLGRSDIACCSRCLVFYHSKCKPVVTTSDKLRRLCLAEQARRRNVVDGSWSRMKTTLTIVAAVAVSFAAYQAASVFAPLVLALFIMAIIWPLQHRLQLHMPKLVALAITIIITIVVGLAFASLAVWAFGRVGRSFVTDAGRYQALYGNVVTWLEGHGIEVAGLLAEHFNVGWLLRAAQKITGRINTTLSFWLIALVYVVLGLLEVDDTRRRIEALSNRTAARVLLDGVAASAIKFRKYLLVRTQMSVVTGLLVGAFAWIAGLQFAAEWGVIAFVLNYIPFIGPFIATLFPTLLAMTQFESWETVLGIFVCLNIIQFVVGSYVEPRVSGSVLSISPFVVLFAIFLWTFIWGLFGTFIGVPIVLAILAFCEQHPSSRWLADLLGGPAQHELKR